MKMAHLYGSSLLKSNRFSWLLNLGLILVVLMQVYLMRELNYWNKDFFDSLQNLQQDQFITQLMRFAGLAIGYFVLLKNIKDYLGNYIKIQWRKQLNREFLNLWKNKIDLESIDHPEQRISEDINELTQTIIDLGSKLIGEILIIISFSFILWQLSPLLFSINWLLTLMATLISLKLGQPLISLNYEQQQKESAFRYLLTFFRMNFLNFKITGRTDRQLQEIDKKFLEVETNFHQKNKRTFIYNVYAHLYQQLCYIFPYIYCAPRVFSRSMSLGDLFQSASAFQQINYSLGFCIESYTQFTRFFSVHQRLKEYYQELSKTTPPDLRKPGPSGIVLKSSDLILLKPNGEVLTSVPNMSLQQGDFLLIQGPSAAGKTTLLKTHLGFWPHYHGHIEFSFSHSRFLNSQSLLSDPTTLHSYFTNQFSEKLSEDLIKEALKKVGLGYLQKSIYDMHHWNQILSQGEKQRLNLASLYFSHYEILFLDEAFSFLSFEYELTFLKQLKSQKPQLIVVSISLNPYLQDIASKRIQL